jgi:hypothetical protein
MKTKSNIFLILLFLSSLNLVKAKTFYLSRDVYKKMPFSTQYSESGALIKNVDYPSVNALIPQLNEHFNLKLEDRKEAHITVVTPPEFNSSLYF